MTFVCSIDRGSLCPTKTSNINVFLRLVTTEYLTLDIMSESKVIILTGASRGIGLAIAQYLLKASHKVVLVARSSEPLEKLKVEYPGQVEYLAADLADFSVRIHWQTSDRIYYVGFSHVLIGVIVLTPESCIFHHVTVAACCAACTYSYEKSPGEVFPKS